MSLGCHSTRAPNETVANYGALTRITPGLCALGLGEGRRGDIMRKWLVSLFGPVDLGISVLPASSPDCNCSPTSLGRSPGASADAANWQLAVAQ